MVVFERKITKEMKLGEALKCLWGEFEKAKNRVTPSRIIDV